MKNRKLRFICRPEQSRSVYRLLREAVFGPSSFKLEREYPDGAHTFGLPDLKAEARFYKTVEGRRLKLSDFIEPLPCPEGSSVFVDGVEVTLLPGDRVLLKRGEREKEVRFAALPNPKFSYDGTSDFDPPDFGITVLGAGHGFDIESRTSGFIIWIDGRGLLVDPPVHTTEWMKVRNLDARLVEDILLTHCHADHDSGTLQKIMEEGRVRLHTTPTVMESFIRKYRSLISLDRDELEKLFDFQPVLMDSRVNILGARFRFWYTFHPVPTLGFEVEHRGQTFAYSCDTLYDPEVYSQLHSQGVMSEARMHSLLDFPWQADLIFHEAGIPPIHTPVPLLADLPEEVRRKMYLTHISEGVLEGEKRLKIAPTGLKSSLILAPRTESLEDGERSWKLLDILLHAELFAECPLEKSLEFLHIARTRLIESDTLLISEGEWGDRFYLVARGELGVYRGENLLRTLRRYDYCGEMAIVLEKPRSATVKSHTPCELVEVSRVDFLKFISNTELPALLRRVAQNKLNDLWPVMKCNRNLKALSPFQRGQLLAILTPQDLRAGDVIFARGGLPLDLYLVGEGELELRSGDGESMLVGRGALIARFPERDRLVTHEVTAVALTDVRLFSAPLVKLRSFFRRNPGTYIRLCRLLRDDRFSVLPGTAQQPAQK